MRLVEQRRLFFREGKSDKVYEVDLCEVGDDAFVVNFRYGRRGSNLREGTKTESAVAEKKARAIYEKLVLSKTSKGYVDDEPGGDEASAPVEAAAPPPALAVQSSAVQSSAVESSAVESSGNAKASKALLDLLAKGDRSDRPLDRVIWSVGERGIREAEPLLLELLALPKTVKENIRAYSLVWALGRCGGPDSLLPLQALAANKKIREETRALIAEVLRVIGNEALRAEIAETHLAQMSQTLRTAVVAGETQEIEKLLVAAMERNDDAFAKRLVATYRYGSPEATAGIRAVLRRIPLQRGTFQAVRAIFKLAEFRRDARIFGLLAHRFETTSANPVGWYDKNVVFKIATRRYLRRRVARTLKRLGDDGSADFVPMAVGTLLPFTDADAKSLRRSTYSQYDYTSGRSTQSNVRWDAYASYWALNTLLYTHSDRYYPDQNGNAWRCVPGYLPGEATAQLTPQESPTANTIYRHTRKREWGLGMQIWERGDQRGFAFEDGTTRTIKEGYLHLLEEVQLGEAERERLLRVLGETVAQGPRSSGVIDLEKREEAFPALWDARPEELLHLVDESRCRPVHQMLLKVLRANPAFCAGLDIDALSLFLKAPYEETAKLGFELIKDRPMSGELAWLLVECPLLEARAHAHQWLQAYTPAPFDDAALWATLILSPHADNQAFVRQCPALTVSSDSLAQTVIARVVAELKGAEDEEVHLAEIGSILLAAFSRQAKNLGEEVLRDLLAHDLLCVQQVGAELLLENDRLATAVPEDLLIALMDSEHASIRTIGIRLLDKKPDVELVQYPELFIHLALHALADVREACRPTIERLAASNSEFGRTMAKALADALSRALPKGAPADAVILLKGGLEPHLPPADKERTLRLLKAKSPHARELGALYLKHIDAEELTLFDIVVLANHEMLSIREAAWGLCEASVARFRITMPAVARLLDAKWEDTREFGLRFVQERFGPEDLGPAVLIAICDSVRPDVQRFGQDLILKYFQEQDGQEYLAKLSEHPSTKLQLFVTNYLERYAADDAAKLDQLSTYFLSVLSRVSRGGVAKRRVLRFLAREGLKSEEAAKVVAKILTRQSVTIAIGGKASIIESMVALRERYPNVELPIQVLETEPRHAV